MLDFGDRSERGPTGASASSLEVKSTEYSILEQRMPGDGARDRVRPVSDGRRRKVLSGRGTWAGGGNVTGSTADAENEEGVLTPGKELLPTSRGERG